MNFEAKYLLGNFSSKCHGYASSKWGRNSMEKFIWKFFCTKILNTFMKIGIFIGP